MNVSLKKQVFAVTNNRAGEFASVTTALAEAGVNLSGICAWGDKDKSYFALLTNNNALALDTLKNKGMQVTEQDIVTVLLEDKVGAAAEVADKIKKAGVSLDYVYGSDCGCANAQCLLVMQSKENTRVVAALK